MKKYKLVKPYPNSLEIGTEVTWGSHGLTGECYEARVKAGIFRFSKETIENNPEFWQEVKQLDYEILTFSDNVMKGVLYKKQSDGKYGAGGFSVEDCLIKYGNSIHSVKRLSDGEIFAVGDKFKANIGGSSVIRTIEKITIEGDVLLIYHEYGWLTNETGEGIFHEITKYVEPKPLFTTEDGVKIFEGNTYWFVDTDFSICMVKALYGCGQYTERKYFSTFELAEDYVIKNAKLISIEDFNNAVASEHGNYNIRLKLIKIAKQRLIQK